MSEPKRYYPQLDETGEFDVVMVKSSDGGFVKWEDYANLKAEVERLRKAGGWLYTELECFHRNEFCDHPDYEEERPSMKAWNAAKDGKPSA